MWKEFWKTSSNAGFCKSGDGEVWDRADIAHFDGVSKIYNTETLIVFNCITANADNPKICSVMISVTNTIKNK